MCSLVSYRSGFELPLEEKISKLKFEQNLAAQHANTTQHEFADMHPLVCSLKWLIFVIQWPQEHTRYLLKFYTRNFVVTQVLDYQQSHTFWFITNKIISDFSQYYWICSIKDLTVSIHPCYITVPLWGCCVGTVVGMGCVGVVKDKKEGIQGSSSCGPIRGWWWGEGRSPPSTNCGRPGWGCHCLSLRPQDSAAARPSALETAGEGPPTVGEKKNNEGQEQDQEKLSPPLYHSAAVRVTGVVNPVNLEENSS